LGIAALHRLGRAGSVDRYEAPAAVNAPKEAERPADDAIDDEGEEPEGGETRD
ncbi:MAG: hypothetical protein JWP87_5805, partial [Labilithrix sp.]|nr:hypothetical protein [Labilithrix sp.]